MDILFSFLRLLGQIVSWIVVQIILEYVLTFPGKLVFRRCVWKTKHITVPPEQHLLVYPISIVFWAGVMLSVYYGVKVFGP